MIFVALFAEWDAAAKAPGRQVGPPRRLEAKTWPAAERALVKLARISSPPPAAAALFGPPLSPADAACQVKRYRILRRRGQPALRPLPPRTRSLRP